MQVDDNGRSLTLSAPDWMRLVCTLSHAEEVLQRTGSVNDVCMADWCRAFITAIKDAEKGAT